jgi:MOSC domain-containing protein YiiM
MPTDAELRLAPLRIDPAEYDLEDAAGTVGSAPRRWRWTVQGLDELPGAALVAMEAMADALAAAGGTGDDLDSLTTEVVHRLRELAARHGPRVRLVDHLGPGHPLCTATEAVDVLLSAAGRAVAAANGAPSVGRLQQLNVGGGGVPKAAVGSAEVWPRGLVGDRQATRRHHGRPFQAVSLYAVEVLAALAAEGHPVGAASVGENLTVSGLPWSSLRPGARLVLGDAGDPVCLELTSWAPPCVAVAGSFLGGDFNRIDHDRHPGWARAYAAVLRPGRVSVGCDVRVLP